jgi:hypothetical protein
MPSPLYILVSTLFPHSFHTLSTLFPHSFHTLSTLHPTRKHTHTRTTTCPLSVYYNHLHMPSHIMLKQRSRKRHVLWLVCILFNSLIFVVDSQDYTLNYPGSARDGYFWINNNCQKCYSNEYRTALTSTSFDATWTSLLGIHTDV